MSVTDAVTSTLSSIINNIVIVVNDANNHSSGSGSNGADGTIAGNGKDSHSYNSMAGSNTTTILPPFYTTFTTDRKSEAVAEGQSQVQVIAVMVMLVIFSVFGCLGNGLVLYVFTKKSDKVTSTIFILALAWTDFITCLVIMPFTMVNIQLNDQLRLDFFCKLYHFLNTSNVPLAAFIMVTIALDRYFSICHPFLHVITPKRARIAILMLVGFTFVLGSITACLFGVYDYEYKKETALLGQVSWCQNDTLDAVISSNISHSGVSTDDMATEPTSKLFANNVMEILINNASFHKSEQNFSGDLAYGSTATEEVLKCTREVRVLKYNVDGMCLMNRLIFAESFSLVYQKIYISFYIISLVAVFTLYFFIYRSVVKRRAWRRKQKSWSHSPMTMTGAATAVDNGNKSKSKYVADGSGVDHDGGGGGDGGGEEDMELSPQGNTLANSQPGGKESSGVGGSSDNTTDNTTTSTCLNATATSPMISKAKKDSHENGVDTSRMSVSAQKKTSRERRDFNFLANIRTAIMLFVVALVFIVSFLPAWLMATALINYQIIVFYMHYIYNVANPVIYAFMNQSFRKELRRVFQRGTHLLRSG